MMEVVVVFSGLPGLPSALMQVPRPFTSKITLHVCCVRRALSVHQYARASARGCRCAPPTEIVLRLRCGMKESESEVSSVPGSVQLVPRIYRPHILRSDCSRSAAHRVAPGKPARCSVGRGTRPMWACVCVCACALLTCAREYVWGHPAAAIAGASMRARALPKPTWRSPSRG